GGDAIDQPGGGKFADFGGVCSVEKEFHGCFSLALRGTLDFWGLAGANVPYEAGPPEAGNSVYTAPAKGRDFAAFAAGGRLRLQAASRGKRRPRLAGCRPTGQSRNPWRGVGRSRGHGWRQSPENCPA